MSQSLNLVDISSLPKLNFLVREKNGLAFFEGPLVSESGNSHQFSRLPFADLPNLRLQPIYDPRGIFICLAPERQNISLHNASDGLKVLEFENNDAMNIEFSPLGRYLITWSMPNKGSNEGNFRIWSTLDGSMVASYSQKVYKEGLLQWTTDERFCFRQASNELILHNADQLNPVDHIAKIFHQGYTQFKIASSSPSLVNIAFFNPDSNGKPARVTLYSIDLVTLQPTGPKSSRTIFGATEARLMWNKSGQTLLVHSQSDIDSSNASYYGATGLYILHSKNDLSAKVEQTKEGPVHDASWSPNGDKFVIVAGNMPCQATLYNEKAEPIYQFGAAHRNTISWSPHGRFLTISGFGNLAGEMDFYDLVRMKKMGSNESHCATTCKWSPDSRYFMTATLAPRMNVDNGVKIFKYNGVGPVVNVDFERAFDSIWKAVPDGTYPDRSATPSKRQGEVVDIVSPPKASISVAAPYRPPHSTGELSRIMSHGKETAAAPVGKVKKENEKFVPSTQKQRVIPGMPIKKTIPGAPQSSNPPKKSVAATTPPAPIVKPAPVAMPPTPPVVETAESKEKRLKALQKKLKQVQEIKLKQQAGQKLDAEQTKKLQTEASLQEEIKSLSS